MKNFIIGFCLAAWAWPSIKKISLRVVENYNEAWNEEKQA